MYLSGPEFICVSFLSFCQVSFLSYMFTGQGCSYHRKHSPCEGFMALSSSTHGQALSSTVAGPDALTE